MTEIESMRTARDKLVVTLQYLVDHGEIKLDSPQSRVLLETLITLVDAIDTKMRENKIVIVIVESPFAGNIEQNRIYAIAACADCFRRGEIPFASHLLYPQILDELDNKQREQGIDAGYAFWPLARKIVFYTDRGWSDGMTRAKRRADNLGYTMEERQLAIDPPKRSEGS